MTEFHTPIARVQSVVTHPDEGLSHLSVVTVMDKPCISGNLESGEPRYKVGDLVLFCPVNSIIPLDFLERQGFYWDKEKGRGLLKGGKRNRVGPVTRGSVTSEGLLFPILSIDEYGVNIEGEVEGLLIDYDGVIVEEGQDLKDKLGITEFKG